MRSGSMLRVALLAVSVAAGACGGARTSAGVSVSYFLRDPSAAADGRGAPPIAVVIDDRRWVDVSSAGEFEFDLLDRDVSLADVALSTDGGIGPCARRVERPGTLQCSGAAPGRRLVRATYPVDDLCVRLGHSIDVELDAAGVGTASVESKFALCTPLDGRTAHVKVLIDDSAGDRAGGPRELASAEVELDGEVRVLSPVRARLPARVELVAFSRGWAGGGRGDVTETLVIEPGPTQAAPTLAPGQATVVVRRAGVERVSASAIYFNPTPARDWGPPGGRLGGRDRDAPVAGFASERAFFGALRVPLWRVPGLRVEWNYWNHDSRRDGRRNESHMAAISSSGPTDERRAIWIEAELGDATRRTLVDYFPVAPEFVGDVARVKVVAVPGEVVRAGFQLESVK